jgi:hypothetical protein
MYLETDKMQIISGWLTALTFFGFLALDSLNFKILLFPGDLFLLPLAIYISTFFIFKNLPIKVRLAKIILKVCAGLVIVILGSYTVSIFITDQHSVCIDGERNRDSVDCYEYEIQPGTNYGDALFSLIFIYLAFVIGKSHLKELNNDVQT